MLVDIVPDTTSDRNTLKGLNCSAICYSVYSSSMQQRHIPAGERWTTCYACFTSLPDTAECWCVTLASCFTRSFTYWARMGWNGMTATLSAKSASCVRNNIHKHVLAHRLDQYVAVPKLASMQMVDTHAIDFVNCPATTTNSVLSRSVMPPHTIILSSPNGQSCNAQVSGQRSPSRLYSSVNRILAQSCLLNLKWRLSHVCLPARWLGNSIERIAERRSLMWRLRDVYADYSRAYWS
jgi:hypothetical protein